MADDAIVPGARWLRAYAKAGKLLGLAEGMRVRHDTTKAKKGKHEPTPPPPISCEAFLHYMWGLSLDELDVERLSHAPAHTKLSSPTLHRRNRQPTTHKKETTATTIETLGRVSCAMADKAYGLLLYDKKKKGKLYKACFSGQECVNWLYQNLALKCRADGHTVATTLLRQGLLARYTPLTTSSQMTSPVFTDSKEVLPPFSSRLLPLDAFVSIFYKFSCLIFLQVFYRFAENVHSLSEDDFKGKLRESGVGNTIFEPIDTSLMSSYAGGGISMSQYDCDILFHKIWTATPATKGSLVSTSDDPPGKKGIFFVKRGRVKVEKVEGGGDAHEMGALEQHQLFGELTLFDIPHSTKTMYYAEKDCEFLVMKAEEVQQVLALEPCAYHRIFKSMAVQLACAERLLDSRARSSSNSGLDLRPSMGDRKLSEVEKVRRSARRWMGNEAILLQFLVTHGKIVSRESHVFVSQTYIFFTSELLGFNKKEIVRLSDMTSIDSSKEKPHKITFSFNNGKKLTIKLRGNDDLARAVEITKQLKILLHRALWSHYLGVLEPGGGQVLEQQDALSWLGNAVRKSKGEEHGYCEGNVGRLLSLMRTQEEPYNIAAATILVHAVQMNLYRETILVRGSAQFLAYLIDFAKEGWAEIHNPLDAKSIELDCVVGTGAAGEVWKCVWNNEVYAAKKIFSECLGNDLKEFKSEVAIMSVLCHPNIVNCLAASLTDKPMLVCKWYERGSLYDVIHNKKARLSMDRILRIALDAAEGMKYLHSFGLVHRDMKPANLLVDSNWHAAVSDFGISRVLALNMTRAVGSSIYIAPEVFDSNVYTKKVDVYGFAYILWGMVERETPYADVKPFDLVRIICEEDKRPNISPEAGELEPLMRQCWDRDPNVRPTFPKIAHELKKLKKKESARSGSSFTALSSSTSDVLRRSSSAGRSCSPLAASLRGSHIPARPRSPQNARPPPPGGFKSEGKGKTPMEHEICSTPSSSPPIDAPLASANVNSASAPSDSSFPSNVRSATRSPRGYANTTNDALLGNGRRRSPKKSVSVARMRPPSSMEIGQGDDSAMWVQGSSRLSSRNSTQIPSNFDPTKDDVCIHLRASKFLFFQFYNVPNCRLHHSSNSDIHSGDLRVPGKRLEPYPKRRRRRTLLWGELLHSADKRGKKLATRGCCQYKMAISLRVPYTPAFPPIAPQSQLLQTALLTWRVSPQ